MDIYFCDICNESVPQPDLALGRAVRRKGRVVCVSCESAMSGEDASGSPGAGLGAQAVAAPVPGGTALGGAPARRDDGRGARSGSVPGAGRAAVPSPSPSSGAFLAGALAAVAILFSVGVLLMLKERLEQLEGDGAYAVGALRAELQSTARSLEADVDAARAFSLDEVDDVHAGLALLRVDLLDELEAAAAQRSGLESSVAGFDARMAELERRVAQLARRGADESRLQADLALLDGELRALSERVRTLQETGALADIEPPKAAGPPPWQGLVDQLGDANAGVRWSAVQALGETGDRKVIPHLLPALDDADIFVRMAAARILGDLGALEAVPQLIETLDDEEPSVREAAAVTLRLLSGRNFRFDPTANESERRRRIGAWEDWWERSRDDLLGGS